MRRAIILSASWLLSALTASSKTETHLLGPTGMMGSFSRDGIQVEKVDKGSPADGKIHPKDHITGTFGKPFAKDPRKELAASINLAEETGTLPLLLKNGKTIEIPLKIYGKFASSAPYDCPKTDALVKEISQNILSSGDVLQDAMGLGWLGLMSTGDPAHLDFVKAELPKQTWANPNREELLAVSRGGKDLGYVGWYWGYRLIALAEYHLLTGDASVLPAIESYALALSAGQDPAGIWGHRMISSARGGRLPGYSHINQPSLSCFIGLTLAQRCGMNQPDISEAVKKCHRFYRSFVGKGTIPYGVHDPNNRHFNNNGMSGSSAVAMAFHRDQEGARFFSRQAANGYETLDTGHASHFFNPLWTPLGAGLSGPEMTREFFKRSIWLYTLYRSWNGRFTYDGSPHKSLTADSALLLHYCIPRAVLHITGKQADSSLWVSHDEAVRILDYSRIDYSVLTRDELLDLFDHEAPQVRRNAVWTLRSSTEDPSAEVEKLLASKDNATKASALEFFGYQCPPAMVDPRLETIATILRDPDEDLEIRVTAAHALACHTPKTHSSFSEILKLLAAEKPKDSLGILDKNLGHALCLMSSNPYEDRLITDKDLFYSAVLKLSNNPRQEGRNHALTLLKHLPKEDFPLVADQVKHLVLNRDPSYHSYHNPQSTLLPGGQLLARLGIQEGPEWAIEVMKTPDGKGSFKAKACVGVLLTYGANSKAAIEKIKSDPEMLKTLSGGRWAKDWQATVQAVETNAPAPPLVPFEDAKKGNFP